MKLKSLLLVLAGNTLYALAIVLFLLPEGMITGGSTGLALAANHYLSLPLSKFLLLFNFSMLVLGAAILGRSFAFTTLVSTFYYPFILQVLQKLPIPNGLTSDRMLSTICGGLLIGFAIGIDSDRSIHGRNGCSSPDSAEETGNTGFRLPLWL